MITLSALSNMHEVNAFILLTSLSPSAAFQAYKEGNRLEGFHSDWTNQMKNDYENSSNTIDTIYSIYIGVSKYDTPICLTILFDYIEHEYMYTIEFFKLNSNNPNKFDTYISENESECAKKLNYEFTFMDDNAVISINEKEIHREEMSLFEFAIGIDRYNPNFTKLSTDKVAGFDEFSTEERQLGIIIPDEFNFFKKYKYVPY